MPASIGTSSVLFRVGSGSPSKVFLGSAAIQTVPGVPVLLTPCVGGSTLIGFYPPSSDGGSAILGYDLFVGGVPYENYVQGFTQGFYPDVPASPVPGSPTGEWTLSIPEDVTGETILIRAYNAIGFGLGSDALTAVFC